MNWYCVGCICTSCRMHHEAPDRVQAPSDSECKAHRPWYSCSIWSALLLEYVLTGTLVVAPCGHCLCSLEPSTVQLVVLQSVLRMICPY